MTPILVILSDNAATDILGLVQRTRRIAVKGGGISLKNSQIIFWTFRDNLLGKNNSRRGGVPIVIQDAKKVINIVVKIKLSSGKLLNASLNSKNEGRFNEVYFNAIDISNSLI